MRRRVRRWGYRGCGLEPTPGARGWFAGASGGGRIALGEAVVAGAIAWR